MYIWAMTNAQHTNAMTNAQTTLEQLTAIAELKADRIEEINLLLEFTESRIERLQADADIDVNDYLWNDALDTRIALRFEISKLKGEILDLKQQWNKVNLEMA